MYNTKSTSYILKDSKIKYKMSTQFWLKINFLVISFKITSINYHEDVGNTVFTK